jgi:beta-lactamase regulating signal transducer with metallopeptidase domain
MTHTIQAVAWTLIHFCWQAAAIAAIYAIVNKGLARRSSNARYVAALSALLLMLAAAAVTFAWELRPASAAGAASLGASFATSLTGDNHTGSPLLMAASASAQPASAVSSLAALLPASFPLWIDAFWLLGVIALSFRSIGGWWLIQRLRSSATIEAPAAAMAGFQRIADALGLRRPVLLRVSDRIAGPLTVGVLRALVLLPLSAATSLSPEELEVVLAHELAHVRRGDFFWNLIQTTIETLFFFHPAVWWVGSRLRHERELCCDDLALKVCPDPLVYARALFRLEEQRGSQWQLAMALDGHQPVQTLRMRIARILGEPLAQATRRGPFSLAAAGALLVILMLPVPQVLAGLSPAPPIVHDPSPAQNNNVVAQLSSPDALPAVAPIVAAPAPSVPARPAPLLIAQAAAQEPQQSEQPQEQQESAPQQSSQQPRQHKSDYIDEMRAAGYDVDLDKMISLKIQGVTPEYARQMAQLGFGKLSADQLISCKIQGVDSEYIAQIKSAGYDVGVDKYIAMKIQGVTPEYADKMAQLGFGKLTADELISSKIQGVTPEYIAELKRDGLEVKAIQDAISYRIFNVTPQFIADMKAAGFGDLDHKQLMSLRVQGVTPEYAKSIRQQYPGATVDDIVKTKIFNINAGFIADAKQHGFTNLTLDKLVKLRISGILDDESDSK